MTLTQCPKCGARGLFEHVDGTNSHTFGCPDITMKANYFLDHMMKMAYKAYQDGMEDMREVTARIVDSHPEPITGRANLLKRITTLPIEEALKEWKEKQ